MLAPTATAARPVRSEITRRLRVRDPAVIVQGFDRPNIELAVETFHDEDLQREGVRRLVAAADPPGILYVATRADAERYADELAVDGLRARPYHAGLDDDARAATHEAFLADDLDVVVAIPAFGMGIDKPNVVSWCTRRCRTRSTPTTGRWAGPAVTGRPRPACCAIAREPRVAPVLRCRGSRRSGHSGGGGCGRRRRYDRSRVEMLRGYTETRQCRGRYLLNY